DPGFSGHVTLELSNMATLPIKLYPGMCIGQLCMFKLSSPATHPYGAQVYGSRYQGQRGPTPSRVHQNFTCNPEVNYALPPCCGWSGWSSPESSAPGTRAPADVNASAGFLMTKPHPNRVGLPARGAT